MSKERRLYSRYTLTTNLHILITPIGLAPRGCKVVDYSRGGMLMESQARQDELPIPLDVDLSRGETAEVSFVDPSVPDRPKYSLSAQIVRVSETHVAVYFLNPAQETIERLEKVIMRHVEQKPKRETGPDKLRRDGSEPRRRVPVTPVAQPKSQFELRRWLIPGASLGALLLLTAIVFYVSKLTDRIDSLEDTLVASVKSRGDGTVLRDVRNELGVLGARVDEVGNRISEVKQRVAAIEARPADAGDGPEALSTQQKQLDAVSDLLGKLQARLETVEKRKPVPVQAETQRAPARVASPAATSA
ncbi:MAG: PilZ domain-containing protein, partial [Gammaproteobacteria bacterium]|nr:PilZ domain-containing protein [Gammaproteobacteria bacterium]